MSQLDKYHSVVAESLSIPVSQVNDELLYQSISTWDSIGHMSLIVNLEEQFDINIEIEDVIDFGSVAKGVEILRKYGVDL